MLGFEPILESLTDLLSTGGSYIDAGRGGSDIGWQGRDAH